MMSTRAAIQTGRGSGGWFLFESVVYVAEVPQACDSNFQPRATYKWLMLNVSHFLRNNYMLARESIFQILQDETCLKRERCIKIKCKMRKCAPGLYT